MNSPTPKRRRISFEEQVAALLDRCREQFLAPGDYILPILPGLSGKSYQVYFLRWARNSGLAEHGWTFRTTARQVAGVGSLKIKVMHPDIVGPVKPMMVQDLGSRPAAVVPLASAPGVEDIPESILLEAWAEFCLSQSLPLDDVLGFEGRTPTFLPTSREGLALVARLRGQS